MKAVFAWLSLLASLANRLDVASGQLEEPLAIGKMPGAGVSFSNYVSILLSLKDKNTYLKLIDILNKFLR